MQEICTATALGEKALTSISYAKVALQMEKTQNSWRKMGLRCFGNVQYHLWINTETYCANAEEAVTKFFRCLKCCFLPEIVNVCAEACSQKEYLQNVFSKDTVKLSDLEIPSTNISELLQLLIALGG